jgi:glycosyltransferase involved in cell wall biosynthesis
MIIFGIMLYLVLCYVGIVVLINYYKYCITNRLVKSNHFAIIIPSYNNKDWYKKNLDSIFNQDYKNWTIYYVDDCSTDDTYCLVNYYVIKNNVQHKVHMLQNDKNYKAAYSRYKAYSLCDDDDILVFLDGDDWLYNNYVLSILNNEYTKYNLNASYGQYVEYNNNKVLTTIRGNCEFPINIITNKSYRKYNWISQHLRTFRAVLLKNIPTEYLQDHNGEWLKCVSDHAESFWALEHSNGKHKNINQILYVYNIQNSIRYDISYFNKNNNPKYIKYYEDVLHKIINKL